MEEIEIESRGHPTKNGGFVLGTLATSMPVAQSLASGGMVIVAAPLVSPAPSSGETVSREDVFVIQGLCS